MNKIFRLIWSDALGIFVPVAEIVSSRGRGAGKRNRLRLLAASLLLCFWIVGGTATAETLPTGGTIVAGSGSIATSGNTMTVTQETQRMAADWTSFSIGQNNSVNFQQPSSSAVALNRVTGADASVIQGALNANGQVFLVNPNGVLFSSTAQVNVGALVASTLNITNDDFMAGNYRFAGHSSNAIVNQGNITTHDGGTIALIAARIDNNGTLTANGGHVLMGAGSKVTLDLGGPVKIQVEEAAIEALIEQGGAIKADGGLVYLTARAAGELAGTVINHTGITEAQTLATGENGQIYLMGDMDNGRIEVAGTLDASAPNGGDGGFVETSAAYVQIHNGVQVSTLAENGKTGLWLIDPNDFTIAASGGDMTAATVVSSLASTNFEIQTATMGTAGGSGNIYVNEDITWSNPTTLTLTAENEVHVNATIENTNTTNGGVFFNAANVRDKVIFDATTGKVIIHNPYQLQWMNQALNGSYELGSDINLNGFTWAPIIVSEVIGDGSPTNPFQTVYYVFSGTFDGLGHTISNLTINDPTRDKVGFFGETDGATIKNVGLVNVAITGKDSVGTLVGINNGTSTIENAYATGSVSGASWVGGLVGENRNFSTIKNSYAIVTVSGTDEQVGGLVGNRASNSPIINSYASGTVSGTTTHVGGLVGYHSGGTVGVTNSYYDNEANNVVTMIDTGFGRTKAELLALVTDGPYDNTIWGTQGSQVKGYATGAITLPFLLSVTKFDNTFFAGGMGINGNPYTITNWQQLQNINAVADQSYDFALSNNLGTATDGYTTQVKDGDALANGGTGWMPIGGLTGTFTGTFDGGDHTIDGLAINRLNTDYQGLFGHIDSATIRNIGLTNIDITGQSYVGGLVGWSLSFSTISTISNSYASGAVTGAGDYVGGLVGHNESSTISNSYASGAVTGTDSVGGLVGYNDYYASIENSFASGAVTGSAHVGGLVGYNYSSSSIDNSYANGAVTGTGDYVGGLVGYNDYYASIENSYANGAVTGTGDYVGGLVGYNYRNTTISNSYASGTVEGINTVGGLVGLNGSSTISNSYAGGAVTGLSLVGGLVGENDNVASVTNSFWGTETSGQASSAGGTGKTTAEMTNSTTFSAWDGAIWSFDAGSGGVGAGYGVASPYLTNVTTEADKAAIRSSLFAGGYGYTAGLGAYTITNWQQLQNINIVVNQGYDFTLSNDLDSATEGYATLVKDGDTLANSGTGWMPIGNGTTKFTGTFDGLGHTIDGLTINRPSTDWQGLFGYTDGATIRNIGLTNIDLTGQSFVGGLVGWNESSAISSSYASGAVTGTQNVVGGLVGANFGSTISNSYASGAVEGGNYAVGGLVGANYGSSSTISNSYASGAVEGINYVGGLVGENANANVTNSYASGTVTGTSDVGGLVGENENLARVTGSFWDTEISGQATSDGGTGKTTAEMMQLATFSGWDIDAEGGSAKIWRIYEGSISPLLRSFLTELIVSATVSGSRVYDGTTDVTSLGEVTYSTPPDSTLLGTLAINTSSKNVATYTSGFTGSGRYSNQQGYDISYNLSGSAQITPYDLTVSGLTANDRVYNATSTAALGGTAAISKLGSDDVAIGGTAAGAFADKNVGTGKAITVTGNTLSGTDADNYNLIQQDGLTAEIIVRPITITADDKNKIYGNDDPTLSWQIMDGTLVGDDTLSGVLTRTAGENVGSYSIDASALANGNYLITANDGALTITARPITITADDKSKQQGQSDPELTFQTEAQSTDRGLVSGDSISGSLIREAGEDTGSYAIEQGTVTNTGNPNYDISYVGANLTIAAVIIDPDPVVPPPFNEQQQAAHTVAQNTVTQMVSGLTNGSATPTGAPIALTMPPQAPTVGDDRPSAGISGGLHFVAVDGDVGGDGDSPIVAASGIPSGRDASGFMNVFVVRGGINYGAFSSDDN